MEKHASCMPIAMNTNFMLRRIMIWPVLLGIILLASFQPDGSDPESIRRGERIAMNYCALCHGAADGTLSGKTMDDIPSFVGVIHTANLTNSMTSGIGKYSKEQLKVMLRTRQRPDGTKLIMPMPAFPLMADQDLDDLVNFLKSDHFPVIATETQYAPQKLGMVGRMFDKKFPVLAMPSASIPTPDTTNAVAWGRYMVTAVYRCYECHSGEMVPNDLDPEATKKYMIGGNTMYDLNKQPVKVPNITPDIETGIGSWTEDDFVKMLATGMRKNGKMARFPMAPMPGLTQGEVHALYTYLRTVAPVKHKVKQKS